MAARNRKWMPQPDRVDLFWSRVKKAGADDCWLWTKGKSKGYGVVFWPDAARPPSRRVYYAHQVAFLLTHGWRPTGDQSAIRHSCHNRLCCNPAHLTGGTKRENNQDSVAGGRVVRGTLHPCAKLNELSVRAIRTRYRAGESRRLLAAEFGVGPGTVQDIVEGRTWKHVT